MSSPASSSSSPGLVTPPEPSQNSLTSPISSTPSLSLTSATGHTTPPIRQPNRPSRKNRHLVVPADTLLTFSSYHPPTRSDSHTTTHPNKRVTKRPPPRPREQFVQANYRFAVNADKESELRTCYYFADAIVPWHSVDVIFLPHRPDCPICLHPLKCPRVTPCGHVFDFVCLLQHIAHAGANDRPAKCPICAHRIEASSLNPCAFWTEDALSVGSNIALRLVSRVRGSMLCHAHVVPSPTDEVPILACESSPFYSRFVFTQQVLLKRLFNRSIKELRTIGKEEPHLAPFVASAMDDLKERKNAIRMRTAPANDHLQAVPNYSSTKLISGAGARPIQTDAPTEAAPVDSDCVDACAITPSNASDVSLKRKDRWYFYQEKNSSNVFLHPLNHRCLSTEFNGDFDSATLLLEGTILQIDRHTMDEQLRRRYRFLEHLPEGCEFAFVEIDLRHILSKKTLSAHAAELKKRHVTRRKKEIEMAKESKRMEREASGLLQEYLNLQSSPVSINVESRRSVDSRDTTSFPALTEEGAPGVDSGQDESDTYETAAVDGSSPNSGWGAEVSSYSSVTSNMGLFPALGSSPPTCNLGNSPQSSNALQGAWGSSSQNVAPNNTKKERPQSDKPKKARRFQRKATVLLSNA